MTLFTLPELDHYTQRAIPEGTAALVQELVEDALYGHPEYGRLITTPPQRGIKGLALEVARRVVINPSNVQTESANGTAVTFMSGPRGVDLTDREVAKLRSLVGDATSYTVELQDPGLGRMVWSSPPPASAGPGTWYDDSGRWP